MTTQIGALKSRLPMRDAEGDPALMRAVRLAGATAIALALALPVAAQQAPAPEPDTLAEPATEGSGEATSPEPALPQGNEAAQAPAPPAETDAGTAGLGTGPTDAAERPVPFDGQIVAQPEGTIAISDLVGAAVTGPDGAAIGKVRDVLLTDQNQIGGILVAVGGFLGFGEKLIGVDIARAHMARNTLGEMSVTLDFGVAELERAPAFVSLEDQRRAAEEDAARQAAEQQLQSTTRGTTAPTPTQ